MANKTLNLTEELYQYLLSNSLREPDILKELRAETAKHQEARMQISPEQGQFMSLLLKILDARRVIEIGVFTGYSALWMALAIPDEGQIVACDVNEEYTAIAKRFWEKAGVSHKIDLRLAPALDTLDELLNQNQSGGYDFVFIDADKVQYNQYYERCLKLIRPGGLITIDNVLWDGKVVDEAALDEDTQAIRQLNLKLYQDSRVDISLIPIADGLTILRKK